MDNKTWEKRKKKLKEKGWIWNKTYQMWDSPNGSAEWAEDLKLMDDEEFEKCIDKKEVTLWILNINGK